MKRPLFLLAALLAIVGILPTVGCNQADEGMTKEETQKSDRLEEIAKKSGGDWNKLSKADHDYLVNTISGGNEHSAQMLFMMKSGKFKGAAPTPGGPPK